MLINQLLYWTVKTGHNDLYKLSEDVCQGGQKQRISPNLLFAGKIMARSNAAETRCGLGLSRFLYKLFYLNRSSQCIYLLHIVFKQNFTRIIGNIETKLDKQTRVMLLDNQVLFLRPLSHLGASGDICRRQGPFLKVLILLRKAYWKLFKGRKIVDNLGRRPTMQKVNYEQLSSGKDMSGTIPESLFQSLLPTKSVLELNAESRILSILSTQSPRILAQQQFTKNEWTLLMLLLRYYPYYAPYETLLASLTSLSCIDCHQRLEEAQQQGSKAIKQELKPVHRALSSLRTKLNRIYPLLKVSLVREAGYVFVVKGNAEII
jgi:hypothetical protein